jgi:hypothetical protein
MFGFVDALRRTQGAALEGLGFGPTECSYYVLASGPHWSLREYARSKAGPCLLIVAAPIKRPYIWDLAPPVSAVRFCVDHGVRVYLLEWKTSFWSRTARGNCASCLAGCATRRPAPGSIWAHRGSLSMRC